MEIILPTECYVGPESLPEEVVAVVVLKKHETFAGAGPVDFQLLECYHLVRCAIDFATNCRDHQYQCSRYDLEVEQADVTADGNVTDTPGARA